MTYDSKSYDLALHFLQDHYGPIPPEIAHELAQRIQQAVEDFIKYELGKEN